MKEKDILEAIALKKTAMEAILAEAENDERMSMNEDEQKRFDAFKTETEALATTLQSIQALAGIKSTVDISTKIGQGIAVRSGMIATGDTQESMRKRFSICEALTVAAGEKKMGGIVAEAHQTAQEELRDMGKSEPKGVSIPSFFASKNPMTAAEAQARIEMSTKDYERELLEEQKRDLTVGVTTAGGHAVATHTQQHIEFLRATLQVETAGARVLTGLTGNVKFPRQDSIPSISWEGEQDSTAAAEGTLEQFTLSPKRASGYADVSDQLRIQGMSNFNVEDFIRTDLNYAVGYGVEDVALEGGASNAPSGITQTSGIGSVALGANGGAITWAKTVEFITDLAAANAYQGRLGFFITPEMAGAMFTTKRDAGSGIFILNDNGKMLMGHPVYWSNVLPKDLTKGSGTALHAALFGSWDELILAQFGPITLLEDPYTQALTGTKRFVINSYWDIGVRHAASFSAILDFDPTA